MWLRIAASAAFAIASCLAARAQSRDISSNPAISLDAAFARVAQAHPQLRLFGARLDGLEAERARASLRPALVAGAGIENALGTGKASGLDEAEITLSLASVFERGGKLDARRTLVQSRIDALTVEREAQRLDLLAETARRYLAVVAARHQARIARLDIEQRERTVAAASARHRAGASPESVVLTAEVALARAELDLSRAEQRQSAARQHLASLWGERAPTFEVIGGDPLVLPEIVEFATLADWLERTPELVRFVGERRVREARLELARSEARPDVDWQFGVRRLPDDDFGVVAGVSIPLGGQGRAQPGIRAARAELAALEIEREAKDLSLYSILVEAHGRYRIARTEVRRLGADVLPLLDRAEAAAAAAYRAGAASYLEWASLQGERSAVRKQRLDAALEAQRALIEIQRLTGQAFVTDDSARTGRGETP